MRVFRNPPASAKVGHDEAPDVLEMPEGDEVIDPASVESPVGDNIEFGDPNASAFDDTVVGAPKIDLKSGVTSNTIDIENDGEDFDPTNPAHHSWETYEDEECSVAPPAALHGDTDKLEEPEMKVPVVPQPLGAKKGKKLQIFRR